MIFTLDELMQRFPPPLLQNGNILVPHGWQKEDIEQLINFDKVGLFLPVGSGKTFVGTYIALGWDDPYRIVCLPPILIRQWVKWLNAIKGSGGAVAYRGSPKERAEINLKAHAWWVMSQQIFKNDFDYLVKMKSRVGDVSLIVDEAQSLKNPQSQNFKLVNGFSAGGKLAMLTGTELNSPADAYSYIKLKSPTVYRSFKHFENMHVVERDFFDNPTEWQGLDTIASNLYFHSTKRSKADVHAHLPKANYYPVEYDLAPAHYKLYRKLMDEQLLELDAGGKIDATTSNALYNMSQQIVANWNHFAEDETVRPTIFDVIDNMNDEISLGYEGSSKVIIWTWFKMTTRLIRDYMEVKFPGMVATAFSESNSVKNVERFMEDPECVVLVAQPGSAGMGLNPQHLCWESLFVETPTRTIPFTQASGRIDREGQVYNANIRIAIASGTVQAGLYQNLLTNDKLVSKVMGTKDLQKIIYGG